MAKKVTRKQSTTSLQKEIAKLKKLKKEAQERKALFAARAKQIKEINALRAESRALKGVGTKRRVAKGLAITGGKTAGKYGWKGLKAVGKFAKNVVEAEAREQSKERAKRKRKRK